MKIGRLAELANCKVVTVRFYEKKGLLPRPVRSASNYREYDEKDAERLKFIRHCRGHGLNLSEIEVLLRLLESPTNACEPAHRTIRGHIESVERQINDLKELKKSLENLLNSCRDDGHPGCGALRNLLKMDDCAYCSRRSCPEEELEKIGRNADG